MINILAAAFLVLAGVFVAPVGQAATGPACDAKSSIEVQMVEFEKNGVKFTVLEGEEADKFARALEKKYKLKPNSIFATKFIIVFKGNVGWVFGFKNDGCYDGYAQMTSLELSALLVEIKKTV